MSSVANSLLHSPANREIAIQDSNIYNLSDELILKIFSFLPLETLLRASAVDQRWSRIAQDKDLWKSFDLKKVFPSLPIIDKTVWERFVDLKRFRLSFEDLEPINNRKMILALKKHFHDVDQANLTVEKKAGWTLVEQPKGLNLSNLKKLAASSKTGDNITCHIDNRVASNFAECTVNKTDRFIISNNVLTMSRLSRLLSIDAQRELAEKAGFEIPKLLNVVSLIVLTHMNSSAEAPTRLYGNDPLTYTRCYEEINERRALTSDSPPIIIEGCFPVIVGSFSSWNDLEINTSLSPYDNSIGVAALRRL